MKGQNPTRLLTFTGLLLMALAAGCSNGKKAPPESAAEPAPQVTAPSPVEPPAPPVEPVAPAPAEPGMQEPVAVESPEAKPEAETPPTPPAAKPAAPRVVAEKPVASEPVPVAPTPTPAKPVPAPPPAARPSAPTLDVNALKERLKETKAIGVFTKLALKNQVDDLLKQFRDHYQTRQPPVTALRQAYNMLVLKVLTLVQDGDPTLAHTIAASREAIWGMLSDPVKFNTLM